MITLKTVPVFALLTIMATGQAGQQKKESSLADIEKAVIARHEEIRMAGQSLDAEKLFEFVLENDKGSLIQDGKMLLTRKEALESTRQGLQAFQKIEYEIDQQHVTVITPKVALLTAEGLSTAVTKDGRAFSIRFAQSVVFVLKEDGWKVLHAHRSFPANR